MNKVDGKLIALFGQSPITYLLRDDFSIDQAAPLTSPRTAVPGPGTLNILQPGNILIISGGELTATAANGSGVLSIGVDAGYSRLAGRAFLTRVKNLSAYGTEVNKTLSPAIGWHNAAPNIGSGTSNFYGLWFWIANSRFTIGDLNTSIPLIADACAADTYYNFAIVHRSTGFFGFINNVLAWVGVTGTQATLYPYIDTTVSVARNPFACDYFRIRDLDGIFASDNGIATLNVASPVDSTLYTGDADAIIDMTIANVTALSICGFKYRYLDANNYWYIYIDAAGAFKVDSVVAGTPTNRVNAAAVAAIGDTRTLRVICDGTKHNFYTLNGTVWLKRGAEIDIGATPMLTATTIVPVIGANWTPTNLKDFPRRSALYNQLSTV